MLSEVNTPDRSDRDALTAAIVEKDFASLFDKKH